MTKDQFDAQPTIKQLLDDIKQAQEYNDDHAVGSMQQIYDEAWRNHEESQTAPEERMSSFDKEALTREIIDDTTVLRLIRNDITRQEEMLNETITRLTDNIRKYFGFEE